jgi:DNA-binding protein HU-beta
LPGPGGDWRACLSGRRERLCGVADGIDGQKALPSLSFLVAARGESPYDWAALALWRSDVRFASSLSHSPDRQPEAPSQLMNKADLVNLVAARTELTKTDVSLVVDAAIETIIDSVVEGKKVSILGFGSFEPRERSERQGLNPKTGEKIKIPAKRVPAFTAGKLFKDRVQG